MPETKETPVYTTPRYGRISAAVWANKAESGVFYKTTLEEHFRDASDGNKWKSTHSLSANELGNVSLAAIDAAQWIAAKRREDLRVDQ